jgi:hypothetical protein
MYFMATEAFLKPVFKRLKNKLVKSSLAVTYLDNMNTVQSSIVNALFHWYELYAAVYKSCVLV